MPKLPPPLLDYISAHLWRDKRLAYFLMDKQGRVLDWGGALEALNLAPLKPGQDISHTLLFMKGLLPLDKPSLELPCVKVRPDISLDVHLFQTPEGHGLLLLDATCRESDLTRFQQKAHEVALLREQHAKIIDKDLGKGLAEQVLGVNLRQPGERRSVTILLADIRSFKQYAEKRDSLLVFQALHEYLSAMIQAVVEEGGVVDNIMGDAVMAIFGIVPSTLSPMVQSLHTASRIFENTKRLAEESVDPNGKRLHVGIGIASGEVVMGILKVGERQTLNVLGDCVNVAACLENRALPGQVIIDRATFDGAGPFQKEFTPVYLDVDGMASPLKSFAWESAP
ncbi:MAG: adenylate/guanylate cyclase domain-containing protein [Thermodesulfobacteriota bacterium]|nr:adenylate/guanylate cyclase domain-containing protein [Thermodesulfobacteriota bacterium]